jgi:hypothetical protein
MKTIAWDVDDVLNDLTFVWFQRWWRPTHPDCRVRWEDLLQNPCHELLGISRESYLQSLDHFRGSGRYEELEPRAEICAWFKRHGAHYHHLALTAVPRGAVSRSAAWVFRHFGDWIRGYQFIPSPRREENIPHYDHNKAAYLGRLPGRVDLMIDDNEETVAGICALGLPALLFPRPWNSSREQTVDDFIRQLVEITQSTTNA